MLKAVAARAVESVDNQPTTIKQVRSQKKDANYQEDKIMKKPLVIGKGDPITDTQEFTLHDDKYVALLYTHNNSKGYGAIFKLLNPDDAQIETRKRGVTVTIEPPVKGDMVTGEEEFEYEAQTYILLEYKRGESDCVAVFERPISMVDIARQYLAPLGVEISTDCKVIGMHKAVRILIDVLRKC